MVLVNYSKGFNVCRSLSYILYHIYGITMDRKALLASNKTLKQVGNWALCSACIPVFRGSMGAGTDCPDGMYPLG